MATRRSGGSVRASASHSTQAGRRDAKGERPERRQQRRPAVQLDLHRPPGVRPQPLERRRFGRDDVVDEEHEPLHHRALGERFHRLEHGRIVGTRPLPRARRGEPARPLPDNRPLLSPAAMILLTGATGYIASHTWLALEAAGYRVAGIDDFSNSSPEVLRPAGRARRRRRRASSRPTCATAPRSTRSSPRGEIEAVVHFAASKAVGESVAEPLEYYANNVGGLVALCRSDARARLQDDRLQLERDGLRPARAAADPRGRAARRDQPVRRDQAHQRRHPARPRARRSGLAHRPAALLQSGRRARERHDRRGPARHAEQPDALRRPGRGRQAGQAAGVRRRLRHARRHRRARLPARRWISPKATSPRCATCSAAPAR